MAPRVYSAPVDQQPECGQAAVRTRRPLRVYETRIFSGHEIGGKKSPRWGERAGLNH
jgi:hypothetical protein